MAGEGECANTRAAVGADGQTEWSRVAPHKRESRRRLMQATASGSLLLVSSVAVMLGSRQDAPLSTLQQQLQFMYAAPSSAVPVPLPATPTLWNAASAVANARAAVGTSYLRRAFPSMPGVRAAAMIHSRYAVSPYGRVQMAGYGVGPGGMAPGSMAYAGVVGGGYGGGVGIGGGYGVTPMSTGQPQVAAYHVSIPSGYTSIAPPTMRIGSAASLPVRYGAGPFWGGTPYMSAPITSAAAVLDYGGDYSVPGYTSITPPMTTMRKGSAASLPARYGAGPFWGANPYVSAPMTPAAAVPGYRVPAVAGYGVPVARVATAQDMAVNAAINAGASAAAGLGFDEVVAAKSPYSIAPALTYAAGPLPYATAPFVSVKTSGTTSVESGLQSMKIVAGPGKGKIVNVNASGKIIGATAPLVTSMGLPQPAIRAVGALGLPMMAPLDRMGLARMGMTPSLGAVMKMSYGRLSSKNQASMSANNAATAAVTAHTQDGQNESQDSSTQEDEEAASTDASEAAATAEDDVTGQEGSVSSEADVVPADASEGDAEKVTVGDEGGVELATIKPSMKHMTPQLVLDTPDTRANRHASEQHDEQQTVRSTEGRERRQSARRADAFSDMTGGLKREQHARPEVLVRVPHGKQPGDFFSAEVAGRGLMLVEVPQGSRGGDDLQLLQMPTDDGEELEWIHYTPTTSLGKARQIASPHSPETGDGPTQEDIDREFATRDSVRDAWRLGQRAPRSYFH